MRLSRFAPVVAVLCACERSQVQLAASADSNSAAATATPSAPDTIVRRVMRVTRTPWMIQRAVGRIPTVRALEPLDSLFALRVLDQRGAEMAGVPVTWRQVNAAMGAAMRVVNAVTDSTGVSRAAFTPGLTASPQGLRAEVADVAGLDFVVRVPVAAIRASASRAEIWSGEETVLSAELRDSSDRVLTGGTELVAWSASDTAVLSVSGAAARGRLAGDAFAIAKLDSAVGRARVSVRPVAVVKFVTLDGAPAPAMRVELTSGNLRREVVAPSGSFSERLEVTAYDEVQLRAWPEGEALHAVHLRVASPRELQGVTYVLVPKMWTIREGSYAGQTIAIDAAAAARRTATSAGFWRLAPINESPRYLAGWGASAFPLRIAFDRTRSSEAIGAADSIAFWAAASQMERDLGLRLFVPAELPREWRGGEVIPVEIGGISEAGHASLTLGENGEAQDGRLTFRSPAMLRDAHVATHELMHLVGFGHTAAWRTVMLPSGSTEARLTPIDVAHAQVAFALRRTQSSTVRPGLLGLTNGTE